MINSTINLRPTGVGALQYQMDMGVSIGLLPKAGAFGENTAQSPKMRGHWVRSQILVLN